MALLALRRLPRSLLALCALATSACGGENKVPPAELPGGGDAASAQDGGADHDASLADAGDGAADGDADVGLPGPECGFSTGKLDLLFVIDNSGSMEAEQGLLAQELPSMVRALASGDVNGDGKQDHPKADLHVGVVSTDMGQSGLSEISSCTRFGDDGLLRALPACPPSPLGYLSYMPDSEDSVAELGEQVACQIQLGIEGCGLEQQLEAALKALTPGTQPVTFALGSLGHGDGPNAGFLRSDSILAIVLVTDEDDCSYPETSVGFGSTAPGSPYADVPMNYRCQAMPELLHPIERYIDTLPELRNGLPGSIVFGVIAGIPPELADGQHSIDEILADPSMAFAPNPADGGDSPVPACTHTRSTGERVHATPARRLLQVADAFGDHAVVASICEETFAGPVEQIAKRIGGVLACPADPIIF